MSTLEHEIALLCDPQGMITRVLCNGLGLASAAPGRLFPGLVDEASRPKALNFLGEIRLHAAAFDWEMNILLESGPEKLHFSGGIVNEQVLIVGSTNRQNLLRLFEDMQRIDNEQTNVLRIALAASSQSAGLTAETVLFDEISRLNNELISMQRELTRKNAELERLNQLKNQFIGMTAHDIRNPLQAIHTYSQLLIDKSLALDPSERDEILADIHNLSRYMRSLVDDLLSISAIEAGELHLDLQSVDLAALLQKNIARNRVLAASKQIDIILDAGAVPGLLLDAAKIEQVLDNLLGNAVKFSPSSGQVIVRLRQTPEGILLTVQDQGIGIAAEDIKKLFKPFGRAHVKGTHGERSTGLGLVIVKRIVEGHGGRIWLKSEAGQGTIFFVSIPLPE